jgi:hypothetical protein
MIFSVKLRHFLLFIACSNKYNLLGFILTRVNSKKRFLIIKKEAIKPLFKIVV